MSVIQYESPADRRPTVGSSEGNGAANSAVGRDGGGCHGLSSNRPGPSTDGPPSTPPGRRVPPLTGAHRCSNYPDDRPCEQRRAGPPPLRRTP